MRFIFRSAIVCCLVFSGIPPVSASEITQQLGPAPEGGRRHTFGGRLNDAELQQRRAERRALWQQRKFEREVARQRWLAASSVNCYQTNTPLIVTDDAAAVVARESWPWAEISFTDSGRARTLALLSPTLSCSYDRHDPTYPGADGDIVGGIETRSGSSQFARPETMTCYRDGAELVRARISNVVINWNGAHVGLSFLNDENKPETLTLDINDIGCIFEES